MDLYWQTSARIGYRMYFRSWVLVQSANTSRLSSFSRLRERVGVDLAPSPSGRGLG